MDDMDMNKQPEDQQSDVMPGGVGDQPPMSGMPAGGSDTPMGVPTDSPVNSSDQSGMPSPTPPSVDGDGNASEHDPDDKPLHDPMDELDPPPGASTNS